MRCLNVVVLLLALVLLAASAAAESRDSRERREECLQECRRERPGPGRGREQCRRECERRYEEEEERGGNKGQQRERDPMEEEKELRECLQQCRQQEAQGRRECARRCEEEYKKRRDHSLALVQEEEEEGERRRRRSPYFLDRESFVEVKYSEHGKEWFTKKFHEQSELLSGIANYRFSMMELEPNTFVRPAHWNAETILYIAYGKGRISSFQRQQDSNGRERQYSVTTGDILRVPVGAITYLANTHSSRKLYIIQLLRPISVPTQVDTFFAAAGGRGRERESYMNSFSNKIIRAAFNMEAEKVQKLFGERRDVMTKASQEQMESLGGRRTEDSSSRGPCNLLDKRPIYSNQRGQYHEVDEEDYPELRSMDVRISLLNLTAGSMLVPSYNTRSTKVAFVTDGHGYIEIVSPRLLHHQQQEHDEEDAQAQQQRYQKFASEVSQGDMFVVPPGHPTVAIAFRGEGEGEESKETTRGGGVMQAVCFEIHARHNHKVFLAGKNSVWQQMERPAKELTFGISAHEVDTVLNAQEEEIFVPGPTEEEEKEEGKKEESRPALPLLSIIASME